MYGTFFYPKNNKIHIYNWLPGTAECDNFFTIHNALY